MAWPRLHCILLFTCMTRDLAHLLCSSLTQQTRNLLRVRQLCLITLEYRFRYSGYSRYHPLFDNLLLVSTKTHFVTSNLPLHKSFIYPCLHVNTILIRWTRLSCPGRQRPNCSLIRRHTHTLQFAESALLCLLRCTRKYCSGEGDWNS